MIKVYFFAAPGLKWKHFLKLIVSLFLRVYKINLEHSCFGLWETLCLCYEQWVVLHRLNPGLWPVGTSLEISFVYHPLIVISKIDIICSDSLKIRVTL
jgi:hypothetical protein